MLFLHWVSQTKLDFHGSVHGVHGTGPREIKIINAHTSHSAHGYVAVQYLTSSNTFSSCLEVFHPQAYTIPPLYFCAHGVLCEFFPVPMNSCVSSCVSEDTRLVSEWHLRTPILRKLLAVYLTAGGLPTRASHFLFYFMYQAVDGMTPVISMATVTTAPWLNKGRHPTHSNFVSRHMLALFLGQETLVLATRELRDWKGWSYFCFIDYAKAFDCVDHNKLWKILKEMGIPEHLTCLFKNLYAGQKQQLELDMEQQTGSK